MGSMLLTLFLSVVSPPHQINGVADDIQRINGGLLGFLGSECKVCSTRSIAIKASTEGCARSPRLEFYWAPMKRNSSDAYTIAIGYITIGHPYTHEIQGVTEGNLLCADFAL